MTLEDDLKAIKEAESSAESQLAQAAKQAESIKNKTKDDARLEEKKALDKTREEMGIREKTLLDSAQKEGEGIIQDSKSTVEKLKQLSAKNKSKASKYLVEEILNS